MFIHRKDQMKRIVCLMYKNVHGILDVFGWRGGKKLY